MRMRPATEHKLNVLARELAAGKSIGEAMRAAGYSEQSAKRGEIRGPDRQLMPVREHPYVAARLEELHAEARARHHVTVDSISEDLQQAFKLAIETRQPGAAVQAAMGKAKLHGLIVDQSKHSFSKPLDQWTEAELVAVFGEPKEDGDSAIHH